MTVSNYRKSLIKHSIDNILGNIPKQNSETKFSYTNEFQSNPSLPNHQVIPLQDHFHHLQLSGVSRVTPISTPDVAVSFKLRFRPQLLLLLGQDQVFWVPGAPVEKHFSEAETPEQVPDAQAQPGDRTYHATSNNNYFLSFYIEIAYVAKNYSWCILKRVAVIAKKRIKKLLCYFQYFRTS